MTSVFLLWHNGGLEEDDEILVGIYSSEENAEAAKERLKDKPGFAEFPDAYFIAEYSIDKDHWAEGFVLDSFGLP